MPKNKIQFQRGLSLPLFYKHYGIEEQCRKALFQKRWPYGGFICPKCNYDTCYKLKKGTHIRASIVDISAHLSVEQSSIQVIYH